jgi:restriction endonuclease-like protein
MTIMSHQGDRMVAERQQSTIGFIQAQRLSQADHFTTVCPEPGYKGSAYRLAPHLREFNLAPSIRNAAPAYFSEKQITWHIHASHGLSSQVCCLNFLMPLATRPDPLSRVIANALGIEPPEMLEIESGPNGEPWFIGFEWIGEKDYLREGGASSARTRGATRFVRQDLRIPFDCFTVRLHGAMRSTITRYFYLRDLLLPGRRAFDATWYIKSSDPPGSTRTPSPRACHSCLLEAQVTSLDNHAGGSSDWQIFRTRLFIQCTRHRDLLCVSLATHPFEVSSAYPKT